MANVFGLVSKLRSLIPYFFSASTLWHVATKNIPGHPASAFRNPSFLRFRSVLDLR